MSRADRSWILIGMVCLASCSSSGGEGGGGGASTTTSLSASAASAAATSSQSGSGGDATTGVPSSGIGLPTTGQGIGGAGGEGAGGEGGTGPAPAECWALQTAEECLAAGCGTYQENVDGIRVVDDACVVEVLPFVCFKAEITLAQPNLLVRTFAGNGPDVIYVRNTPADDAFSSCGFEDLAEYQACCCLGYGPEHEDICGGITPLKGYP